MCCVSFTDGHMDTQRGQTHTAWQNILIHTVAFHTNKITWSLTLSLKWKMVGWGKITLLSESLRNFKNAKEKARINTTLEKSDMFPTQNIYYNIN